MKWEDFKRDWRFLDADSPYEMGEAAILSARATNSGWTPLYKEWYGTDEPLAYVLTVPIVFWSPTTNEIVSTAYNKPRDDVMYIRENIVPIIKEYLGSDEKKLADLRVEMGMLQEETRRLRLDKKEIGLFDPVEVVVRDLDGFPDPATRDGAALLRR